MRISRTILILAVAALAMLPPSVSEATCRLRRLERLQYRAAMHNAPRGTSGSAVTSLLLPLGFGLIERAVTQRLGLQSPASVDSSSAEFECDINDHSGLDINSNLRESGETLQRINEKLKIQSGRSPDPSNGITPPADPPPQPGSVPNLFPSQ